MVRRYTQIERPIDNCVILITASDLILVVLPMTLQPLVVPLIDQILGLSYPELDQLYSVTYYFFAGSLTTYRFDATMKL